MRLRFAAPLFVLSWFCTATLFAGDATQLRLVPFPKQVELFDAEFSLKGDLDIFVSEKEKPRLASILEAEFQRAALPKPRVQILNAKEPMLALRPRGITTPITTPTLPIEAGEGKSDANEAYALSVTPDGVLCLGKGDAGLYYAVQTLCQLIRANRSESGTIPGLTIRDWPSMKYRCFQDDLTRGPSPHLETLFYEFDLGAQLKHNMFTYYMENQFEFKKHPKLNPENGTLTQEDFKKCVEFAAERHLIVLGNQQSFGHHSKTLAVPEYAHLGEAGYILSPTVEAVYPFLDDLYSEIMPLVPFEMFNVCCDETWDLAKSGASKELADKIGVAGVYVQHIRRVHELLKKYDKRMMMWGDIIVEHPDKLNLIPKDVVMMC